MSKIMSIITVCYNKWNFTKSCLKDLAQLPKEHEIIIIDNASSDETNQEINKLLEGLYNTYPSGSKFYYTRNKENAFHSKACNQGFRRAAGETVLFLNNDIRVKSNHSSWTKTLIDTCNSTNGLVGPTMGLLDKQLNFVKEGNQQLSGNSYLGGWCVAAKREIWEQMKLEHTDQVWNEEFPFYFNDADLSFRARQKNIPLTVVSLPELAHFGKVSAAQINIPKLYKEGRNVFLKQWA